jgi:hypothetical protein
MCGPLFQKILPVTYLLGNDASTFLTTPKVTNPNPKRNM